MTTIFTQVRVAASLAAVQTAIYNAMKAAAALPESPYHNARAAAPSQARDPLLIPVNLMVHRTGGLINPTEVAAAP